MRGFRDFAVDDLVEGVEALALGRRGVHQMHLLGLSGSLSVECRALDGVGW